MKLKGAYYVRPGWDSTWDVTSETDDDALYIQGVPTKELAERLRDVINAAITPTAEPTMTS